MIENLEFQANVGGPPDDDFINKTLIAISCIMFFLLCCCACGHFDEDQQDRQVEPSNNSNPTTTGDDRHDSAVPSLLPVFVYSSTAHEADLECSLCLTEFKDGEMGRFLPRCCHGFHKECVDAWLNSHSTCPLCRSSVEFGTPDLNV